MTKIECGNRKQCPNAHDCKYKVFHTTQEELDRIDKEKLMYGGCSKFIPKKKIDWSEVMSGRK